MARTKQAPKASGSGKAARKSLALKQHKSQTALKTPHTQSSKSEAGQSAVKRPKTKRAMQLLHERKMRKTDRLLKKSEKHHAKGKHWQTHASSVRMMRDAIMVEDEIDGCDSSRVRVTKNAICSLNSFVENTMADIMKHAYLSSQWARVNDSDPLVRMKPRWVVQAMSMFSEFCAVPLTAEYNRLAQQVPEYNEVSI
jgi:hypothetical protein